MGFLRGGTVKMFVNACCLRSILLDMQYKRFLWAFRNFRPQKRHALASKQGYEYYTTPNWLKSASIIHKSGIDLISTQRLLWILRLAMTPSTILFVLMTTNHDGHYLSIWTQVHKRMHACYLSISRRWPINSSLCNHSAVLFFLFFLSSFIKDSSIVIFYVLIWLLYVCLCTNMNWWVWSVSVFINKKTYRLLTKIKNFNIYI